MAPPKYPGPSGQEQQLLQGQIGDLERARTLQDLIAPFLFEAYGLEAIKDGDRITGFRRTPQGERAFGIHDLQLKRSEAALKGELPLDPALLQNIAEEEMDLRSFLRQRFGPDYETSTPAIEALDQFSQTKLEMLDAARRGDMTLAEGLSMQRQGGIQASAAGAGGTAEAPLRLISGASGPLSFLRGERQAQHESSASRRNFWNELIGQGVSMGMGAIGGAAMGPEVGLSGWQGAAVGASGGLGTMPFLSMRRGGGVPPYRGGWD